MRRSWGVGLALVSLVSGNPSGTRADDQLELTASGKRTTVRGKIKEENRKEVVIETTSGVVHVPIHELEHIRYDKQPAELITIRSKLDQGKYDEAIEGYKNVARSALERQEFLKIFLAFSIFRAAAEQAMQDVGKTTAALAHYEKFMQEYPDSRHHYAAHELAGRLYLNAGDPAKAGKALAMLKEVDWPGYREKGMLYAGVVELLQNRPDAAIVEFDRVLSANGDSPMLVDQRHSAAMYKGEALVRRGQLAEAEKLVRQTLAEIPATQMEIKAIGCNALGDALRGLKRPKEALFDGYLKVVVLYNTNPEQVARAMFNLTEVFAEIEMRDHARKMADRLKAEYPTSSWAKKLRS